MPTPIVLIHGFPFDGSMWDQQVTALHARGHHVLAPHLPGFGPPTSAGVPTAAWPKHQYSVEALADEIHALIQTFPEKSAVVGGFSMGGYILLSLIRDHPESVKAAMVINSRAEADTPDARATRLKSIETVEATGSTAALIDGMLGKQLSRHAPPAVRDRARTIMARQAPEAVIGAQWAMSRRRDQTDLLPTLTIPLLLIVGADDAITPPSVAMGIHNHCPHAMLVQVARAGHLTPLEQPDSVTSAIDTFTKTLI